VLIIGHDSRLILVRYWNKYRYSFSDEYSKSYILEYNRIYKYFRYDKKYITQKYDDYDLRGFKCITYRIYGIKFSIGYYCGSDMIYNRFSFANLWLGDKKYEMNKLQISANGYIKYCTECVSYIFAEDITINLGYNTDHMIYIVINEYRITDTCIFLYDVSFDKIPIMKDIRTTFAHLTPNSAKIWHKNGGLMADINYNNSKIVSYAIYHENGDVIKMYNF
jgi:hypothetical protein